MTNFKTPVLEYMSQPVITMGKEVSGADASRRLVEAGISAVGVTDGGPQVVGVVSRTDLLSAESGETAIGALMTPGPITVAPDSPLDAAASLMLQNRVHRVFVEKDGDIVGVLSTRDLMRAVADKQVKTPAIEIASTSIIRVRPTDPVGLAVDRLEKANKHGLVVVEDTWPLGIFAQREALAVKGQDLEAPVESAMNLKVMSVPPQLPLYRVAQQALQLGVRRILLVEHDIAGVISTFDFARVVK
ncbi:MAG: CBS domain-containing protein [Sandaracinaceae bacterium]